MSRSMLLADQLDGSREWTLRLIEDLSGDAWTYQPAPGLQHALWICGHLAVASDLLVTVRSLNRPPLVEASFGAHFPIGGPILSAAEHDFPSPAVVRETMDRVHAGVLELIRSIPDAQLEAPALGKDGQSHPHYSTVAGAISHASRHEAFHAGQLASLRRLQGKPFLR